MYRLASYPSGDQEDLIVVWLATDGEAVFSHETALSLHRLSDLLPGRIHVRLPRSWHRRRLPDGVVRHEVAAPLTARTWIGDVPVTTPLQTLADCLEAHVSPEFMRQALAQARARGLISAADAETLVKGYDHTKYDILAFSRPSKSD